MKIEEKEEEMSHVCNRADVAYLSRGLRLPDICSVTT